MDPPLFRDHDENRGRFDAADGGAALHEPHGPNHHLAAANHARMVEVLGLDIGKCADAHLPTDNQNMYH
ncbi:hypothetical protein D3C81_1672570 [compost metagenome]